MLLFFPSLVLLVITSSRASDDNICKYPFDFRCNDGTCMEPHRTCDGPVDCPDGSDETRDLCQISRPVQGGKCRLPPYPRYGTYNVVNNPDAVPGHTYPGVLLYITCQPGYMTDNMKDPILCVEGVWSREMPKCISFCRLPKHPNVKYRCLDGGGNKNDTRECGNFLPHGTVVKPVCRSDNYFSPEPLVDMNCIDGRWDNVAQCVPECGLITPEVDPNVKEGRFVKRGELPWFAGIYNKKRQPYEQICGGSLVTNTAIISAAHCFWKEHEQVLLPASNYAVAVGKLYRPWDDTRDAADAQKSDVSEIKIALLFLGAATYYQNDISIVTVVTPFVYQKFIRPVCLNFDVNLNRIHTSPGILSKVVGWIAKSEVERPLILKVVYLPMMSIVDCIEASPVSFRPFITSDKICSWTSDFYKGNSGVGLASPSLQGTVQRYYLLGLVSVAPRPEENNSTGSVIAFTNVIKHERFIRDYLDMSE